ncbi:MAG: esterase family protein [Firmicutes bacterium]|nr:esterase family protein [Bacillota bacterium]
MAGHTYRIEQFWLDSRLLRGNPWGDPARREVLVLTPSELGADTPLPLVYVLPGYAGNGRSLLSFSPWQENFAERLTRLSAEADLPPARFVLPDVFCRLGGSQYLDSPAIGPYASYLWEELAAELERRYPVSGRAVMGKSSGGFGALTAAMDRPGYFQAVVCHSGDMAFEWCYLPEVPKLARAVAQCGGVEAFLEAFWRAPKKPSAWIEAMNLVAMAAAYSPIPDGNAARWEFPVDLETLELRPEVWGRWLAWDPVRRVEQPSAQDALRQLRLLYFDAGERDQYQLQYGARRLHRRLTALGIPHLFETYPDNHFQTQYRYDRSLPLVVRALYSVGPAG